MPATAIHQPERHHGDAMPTSRLLAWFTRCLSAIPTDWPNEITFHCGPQGIRVTTNWAALPVKIKSGTGDTYTVDVYGRGPDGAVTYHDATLKLLSSPARDLQANDWLIASRRGQKFYAPAPTSGGALSYQRGDTAGSLTLHFIPYWLPGTGWAPGAFPGGMSVNVPFGTSANLYLLAGTFTLQLGGTAGTGDQMIAQIATDSNGHITTLNDYSAYLQPLPIGVTGGWSAGGHNFTYVNGILTAVT